jgi:hypothetical protein
MEWTSKIQQSNELHYTRPDKRCSKCQFRAKAGDPLQSGVHECMKHAITQGWLQGRPEEAEDRTIPLSIDLWAGNAGRNSIAGKVTGAGHAFLRDILERSINPNQPTTPIKSEFTSHKRRMMQIDLESEGKGGFRVQKETIRDLLGACEWPWHMIDFETSAPSIPFFKGMKAYENVAFQFSYHKMERNGTVTHMDEFIRTDADGNPNIDFVRALRKALMPDGKLVGTVFRYSAHENTVLRKIRAEIEGAVDLRDKEELLHFINQITQYKNDGETFYGDQNMVDLRDVVLKGYISHHAGGSNSLKYILPAILKDAPKTSALYSKPGVYGHGLQMHSLNFDNQGGHIWLTNEAGGDPYKTLPPLFDGLDIDSQDLDELITGFLDNDEGKIDQGGLAMAAYNLTRYTDLSDEARVLLRNSLLRYCELDTLAMCMLAQGLLELSE